MFLLFFVLTTYIGFTNGPCRLEFWLKDWTDPSVPSTDSRIGHIFNHANKESQCSTPSGGAGTCISIYECPLLLDLVRKPSKTSEDFDLLRKSQCGFEGNIPKACCPSPCYTPDGQPGKCTSIYSCPHLASMLQPPISNENKLYVQNSRCQGSQQYSVCCGPPRDNTAVVPFANCPATVNALPPNPRTECCGVESRVENKIVGGNVTTVDQYPWLGLVEYKQGNQIKLLCGCALISSRYVLSAAHCVAGDILTIARPINIRLGEYDTNNEGPDCAIVEAGGQDCTEGTVIIPIETYLAHPGYSTTRRQSPNDIALIRMTQAAPYTDFIRPICLPTSDITLSPPVNFTLYVAGWGAVSLKQASSNVKLFVGLPYVEKNVCQPAYSTGGRNLKLTSGQICAGGQPGKDSCKGDSGGPLMYENGRTYELIGIVSFGPSPCGLPNVPGIYTKVFEYLAWIRSNMKL